MLSNKWCNIFGSFTLRTAFLLTKSNMWQKWYWYIIKLSYKLTGVLKTLTTKCSFV